MVFISKSQGYAAPSRLAIAFVAPDPILLSRRSALRFDGIRLRLSSLECNFARCTKPTLRCAVDKVHCEKLDRVSFVVQYGRDDSMFFHLPGLLVAFIYRVA